MFTGLIEEVGRVLRVQGPADKRRLQIGAKRIPRELKKGESIAVSGVCLTAVEVAPRSFSADLAAESWARTSFSRIKDGALVNLELPMAADGRLGGHIVQGHVDGVGKVVALKKTDSGDDYLLTFEIPTDLTRYVVFKGSIAVEGISLTVARVQGNQVSAAIIPHTFENTNLKSLQAGDLVNLETDIIAKYVAKMLSSGAAPGGITVERLIREGF